MSKLCGGELRLREVVGLREARVGLVLAVQLSPQGVQLPVLVQQQGAQEVGHRWLAVCWLD